MNLDPRTAEVMDAITHLKPNQIHIIDDTNTGALRSRVRKHLTSLGIGDNIVLSVSNNNSKLVILKKEKPYVVRLEDMVRALMNAVDDENLYDEALRLLDSKYD